MFNLRKHYFFFELKSLFHLFVLIIFWKKQTFKKQLLIIAIIAIICLILFFVFCVFCCFLCCCLILLAAVVSTVIILVLFVFRGWNYWKQGGKEYSYPFTFFNSGLLNIDSIWIWKIFVEFKLIVIFVEFKQIVVFLQKKNQIWL